MSEQSEIAAWPRDKMYEIEELDDRRAVIRIAVNCDGNCTDHDWQRWVEVVETHESVAIYCSANRFVLSRWLRLVNRCGIAAQRLGATFTVVGLPKNGLEKADELQLKGLLHVRSLEEAWES